jgi:GST-like protein
MTDLSMYPVTKRWPAKHPDRLQLYAFPTPNGVKVSIALEELGLPYEAHKVTLSDADVKSPEFLSLNPNNKIPAILDPNGPDGQPLALFESGAILVYLAEKTGALLGRTPSEKYRVLQWVMFQMGGVGPMFGQLGFFHKFAGAAWEDKRPHARYLAEAKRLLAVLEGVMTGQTWIAGDYSIADIAIVPWLRALDFYGAHEAVGWASLPALQDYVARFAARPAVARGLGVPA